MKNIIRWFKQTAGKVALSTMQMAGAGAVVAVAGIGAYQYLNSPVEGNNNTFAPSSYNEDVVYVGMASGGTYGTDEKSASAVQVTQSRAIELNERQAIADKRAAALQESRSYYSGTQDMNGQDRVISGGQDSEGYAFGGTSNLGMGGDKGPEAEGGFDAFGGSFSNIQDMIQNQTAAMQAAAAGAQDAAQQGKDGKGGAAGLSAAAQATATANRALASVPHNWGQSPATAGNRGGSGVNNEFTVQNSGKNGPNGDMGGGIPEGDFNMGGSAEDDPALALNGKFSNFGRDRDGTVGRGRTTGQGGAELEQMRKQSADIANNDTRSANEPGSIFMAGNRLSGGMRVDSGAMASTGAGVNSPTFVDPYVGVNTDGVKATAQKIEEEATQIAEENEKYMKAKQNYVGWLIGLAVAGLAAMIAIPILTKTGPWGWVAAIILAAVVALLYVQVIHLGNGLKNDFANNEYITYDDTLRQLGLWGGGALMALVGLSFVFPTAFQNFFTALFPKLMGGISSALGTVGGAVAVAGVGTAAVAGGSITSGVKNAKAAKAAKEAEKAATDATKTGTNDAKK